MTAGLTKRFMSIDDIARLVPEKLSIKMGPEKMRISQILIYLVYLF
jgi:hypothetical protein